MTRRDAFVIIDPILKRQTRILPARAIPERIAKARTDGGQRENVG